jgi:hypothetical protein
LESKAKMKDDTTFDVHNFAVLANLNLTSVSVRAQIVDQLPSGPQLSEKYVRLTMTTEQAMFLLAMLQAVQARLSLGIAGTVHEVTVPPAKERN